MFIMQNKHKKKCIPNNKKVQKTHESVRAVQGCFWSPVENREGPIKSVLCGVRPSRFISETAPRIFPKPGTKLGVKNVRNVARPLFRDFGPFFRKPLICAKKIHFWQFLGLCGKSVPRIFLKSS